MKTVGDVWAFVPSPLPPEIEITWDLARQLAEAERAVGNLRGMGRSLPNPHLLTRPLLRREAVLSCRIDGTQSTLGQLVLFEAGAHPDESSDVQEVANYVTALMEGLSRIEQLPPNLSMLRELHRELMAGVHGGEQNPGEFRRQQNWIGRAGSSMSQATYVPPPVPQMESALDALEKYLHAESPLPSLVRAALVHYQFEAIHPFLAGNGRVGRLLLALLLQLDDRLDPPLLYLSAYFERRRSEYDERLRDVSRASAWQEWISFFLRGVSEQAKDAVARADRLFDLRRDYRDRVSTARNSGHLGDIIDQLFLRPALSITEAGTNLGITYPAAKKNVDKLVSLGVLVEPEHARRNKIYVAPEIIRLLED